MAHKQSSAVERPNVREAAARIKQINARIGKIGVSQRILAEQAGMHQPQVNRVLTGNVPTPTFWTLLRLEQALTHFEQLVAKTRRAS